MASTISIFKPIESLWDYLERKLEKLPTTALSLSIMEQTNDLWDEESKLLSKQGVGTQSTRHLHLQKILFYLFLSKDMTINIISSLKHRHYLA